MCLPTWRKRGHATIIVGSLLLSAAIRCHRVKIFKCHDKHIDAFIRMIWPIGQTPADAHSAKRFAYESLSKLRLRRNPHESVSQPTLDVASTSILSYRSLSKLWTFVSDSWLFAGSPSVSSPARLESSDRRAQWKILEQRFLEVDHRRSNRGKPHRGMSRRRVAPRLATQSRRSD
jgi:hypothetical protein